MLFSIEITASSYQVSNLSRAFLTSVVTLMLYIILGNDQSWMLFDSELPIDFDDQAIISIPELLAFVCLGGVCGLGGVLFVHTVSTVSSIRNYLISGGGSSSSSSSSSSNTDKRVDPSGNTNKNINTSTTTTTTTTTALSTSGINTNRIFTNMFVRKCLYIAVVMAIISSMAYFDASIGFGNKTFVLNDVFQLDKPHEGK